MLLPHTRSSSSPPVFPVRTENALPAIRATPPITASTTLFSQPNQTSLVDYALLSYWDEPSILNYYFNSEGFPFGGHGPISHDCSTTATFGTDEMTVDSSQCDLIAIRNWLATCATGRSYDRKCLELLCPWAYS